LTGNVSLSTLPLALAWRFGAADGRHDGRVELELAVQCKLGIVKRNMVAILGEPESRGNAKRRDVTI
jgi:hypothetical protein